MSDPNFLFEDELAPLTSEVGLIECPVDAVVEAFRQFRDPDQRRNVAAHAARQAARFNWTHTAHATHSCYRQATG